MKRVGNLYQQIYAEDNLKLAFLKENLQCKSYVRYMDDFIIWDKSFVILKNYLVKVESFLKDKLDLTLKNDIQINKVEHGIPFLGYRVFPQGFKLKKESLKRFKRKFSKEEKNYSEYKISEIELIQKVQSLFASINYGTKTQVRNCIIDKYSVYY